MSSGRKAWTGRRDVPRNGGSKKIGDKPEKPAGSQGEYVFDPISRIMVWKSKNNPK